ncbi:MAG: ComEA family DNA-binding protein [Candidatus Daviesbacteria bacterium]|nr:ComEA family DNA-binding protein [Candidatus Daviesbacteria bacterium]
MIVVGIVGIVLFVGGIISSGIIPKTFKSDGSQTSFIKSSKQYPAASMVSGVSKSIEVKVDVGGAVNSPGVYSLASDSRVEDALKLAGGVTEKADPVYVAKSINLAQKVADGMKIYVPSVSETPSLNSSVAQGDSSTTQSLININEASLADLDKLSGVGAVTAQKIIDNRPYSGIEELVTKKAVSRSVYEKIKAQISTW